MQKLTSKLIIVWFPPLYLGGILSRNYPPQDKPRPVSEHLEELVTRLRVCIVTVLITSLICFLLPSTFLPPLEEHSVLVISNSSEGLLTKVLPLPTRGNSLVIYILNKIRLDILASTKLYLKRIFGIEHMKINLKPLKVYDAIVLILEASILLGLILSSPVIAYEIYKFIAPALYPHEKKFLTGFTLAFVVFFLGGLFYAYKVITPLTLAVFLWMNSWLGLEPVFWVKDFYEFTIMLLIFIGALFTLPVVIVLAAYFKVFNPRVLRKYWRYFIIAVFTLAAIITPDPTPISMTLVSIPFLILYTIATFVGELVYRRSSKLVKTV